MADKQTRCSECGYRLRGAGHAEGPHHRPVAIRAKGGKPIHKSGPMRPKGQPLTQAKDKGRGFDFDAVKRGGLPRLPK